MYVRQDQDRRPEASAAGIVGSDFAITHARLAHRYRNDTGTSRAGRRPRRASPTALGFEIGMLGEEIGDLGLSGLSQQAAGGLPEDFTKLCGVRSAGMRTLKAAQGRWLVFRAASFMNPRWLQLSVDERIRQRYPQCRLDLVTGAPPTIQSRRWE